MEEEVSKPSKRKKVSIAIINFVHSYIPITEWLPKYKWKEYFLSDFMAGLTLGSLHIPQGMAFSMLARVNPKMGLNTACFSLMVYCLFGTGKISSFGPVSVTSLLTGEAIVSYNSDKYTNDELAEAITFFVGVVYFVAFVLRFYVLAKLFTKHLTSAFIVACSGQVIIKSFKLILGIKAKEAEGYFSVIYNTYYTFRDIQKTNLITLSISVCVLLLFMVNTFAIIPLMKKWTKFIIPTELIVLIIFTTASYFLHLDSYDVHLLGIVPMGLPQVSPPQVEIVPFLWQRSLVVAMVNYATTLTMLLMCNADVEPNQELLALGITNLVCCNFQTIPLGNSMMRTVVAKNCGVKTLLSSVIASFVVLLVILFMGPVFSPLPLCVLGCIIIYGLSSLIVTRLKELPEIFNSGIENALIWVITGTVTLFISMKLGLIVGLLLTLRQLLAQQYAEKREKRDSVLTSQVDLPKPKPSKTLNQTTQQKTQNERKSSSYN